MLSKRIIAGGVAGAVLVILLAVGPVSAASKEAKVTMKKLGLTGVFVLTVGDSGKCLAKAGGAKMGKQFHAWRCRKKSSNQPFKIKWADGDWFMIHSERGGQCLDVSGGSKKAGKPVVQWTCKSGPNQLWKIIRHGKKFQLKVRHSGLCLTLDDPKGKVSKVVQRKCNTKNPGQMMMVRN